MFNRIFKSCPIKPLSPYDHKLYKFVQNNSEGVENTYKLDGTYEDLS